ncbi:MAG: hypothetical protein K2M88_08135 [Muribaculaceae bacterium]|nr:hypothetical protein [Muribaculaceae bacterium]
MAQKNKKETIKIDGAAIEARRKKMEAVSTFGLIIIAVAMFAPFVSFNTGKGINWLSVGKWIYAAGALIFTFARLVSVNDPRDSLRLRRLRRLEFWAGMAFCVGAFFWFYNESKFSSNPFVGPLAIVRDTVLFSLAGATIQVIASWMIAFRQNKEKKEHDGK